MLLQAIEKGLRDPKAAAPAAASAPTGIYPHRLWLPHPRAIFLPTKHGGPAAPQQSPYAHTADHWQTGARGTI